MVTPINLTSPLTVLAGNEVNEIIATTSIYANAVSVELFRGIANANTLNMTEVSNDGITKTWSASYLAPNSTVLPEAVYNARFTARTPNGNVETLDRQFELQHLKISSMSIWGEWNHWRGQVDLFGKTLVNMPHRFLGYEKVHVDVIVEGNPDFVDVRFSPELEAMIFTNSLGHTYSYFDHVGYNVSFPLRLTSTDNRIFTVEYILPLADSTLDVDDNSLGSQYWVTVTAHKGILSDSMTISDLDMTGNILDQMYVQPE